MNKETLSTSEKEIPKHRNALSEKYKEEAKGEPEPLNPENIQKQKEQLPEPSGWRLLVLPFTPKEKTKGGILIAQESLEKLRIATNCGYVLKVGPLAYYDKGQGEPQQVLYPPGAIICFAPKCFTGLEYKLRQ